MAALRAPFAKVDGEGPPEQLSGQAVSSSLFPLLGVSPMLGRTFSEQEETDGSQRVVVSYRLWQRRLGSDANAIGRTIRMNDKPYEVIGVMPRGFHFPDRRNEFWFPLGMSPELSARRNSHFLRVGARLKPGVSWKQAQADMAAIAQRLAREYPITNRQPAERVVPLSEEIRVETRPYLVAVLAAAACVLLIACANVANLLLVRAQGRRREVSVRMALGAGRARLVPQMLTESLLLACIPGLAGRAAPRQ